MKLIDLHCDTVDRLLYENLEGDLDRNKGHVDLTKLAKVSSLVQVFAMYVDLGMVQDPYDHCLEMLAYFKTQIQKSVYQPVVIKTFRDLDLQRQNVLISVEEGGVLDGKMERLLALYEQGVRSLTLTWNYENELGFPNAEARYSTSGLKPFGKDVVSEMNRLGMIIDVSHLSDQGFWDVHQESTDPFMASHSCARSVHDHPRNLTDPMIRAIADKGGVIGLNFYSEFIDGTRTTTLDGMMRHINHIYNVGGSDVLAVGTDFDGIDCSVEVADISQMGKLIDHLKSNGFNDTTIEKIMYRNSLRVFENVLK